MVLSPTGYLVPWYQGARLARLANAERFNCTHGPDPHLARPLPGASNRHVSRRLVPRAQDRHVVRDDAGKTTRTRRCRRKRQFETAKRRRASGMKRRTSRTAFRPASGSMARCGSKRAATGAATNPSPMRCTSSGGAASTACSESRGAAPCQPMLTSLPGATSAPEHTPIARRVA